MRPRSKLRIAVLAITQETCEVTASDGRLKGPPARASVSILAPKLVTGQSITQTLQFVDSGNAEIGFVAASQVAGKAGVWLVPDDLYNPICQDVVLLAPGEHSPAARDFLDFLKSEAAAEAAEEAAREEMMRRLNAPAPANDRDAKGAAGYNDGVRKALDDLIQDKR